MDIAAARLKGRQTRHRRIRKKISGTNSRPRLAVFRSARHIYVQAIDDHNGNTLACSSTLTIQKTLKKIYTGNKEAAKAVGAANSEGALQALGNIAITDGMLLTDNDISSNVFIPSGKNGLLIGTVNVAVGATIDVAPGSTLVVV